MATYKCEICGYESENCNKVEFTYREHEVYEYFLCYSCMNKAMDYLGNKIKENEEQ